MSGPPRNATVLNTTVLSNFAHVGRVELLLDLPQVVTVEAVQRELDDGIETHPYLTRWIDEAGFRSPSRDIRVFLDE